MSDANCFKLTFVSLIIEMPRGRRSRKQSNVVGVGVLTAPVPVSVLTQNITNEFSGKGTKSYLPNVHTVDVAVRPTSLSVEMLAKEPCIVEWEARTGPAQSEMIAVLRTKPILVGTVPQVLKLRVPRSVDPSRYADWTVRVGSACIIAGTVTFSYRDGLSGDDKSSFATI